MWEVEESCGEFGVEECGWFDVECGEAGEVLAGVVEDPGGVGDVGGEV